MTKQEYAKQEIMKWLTSGRYKPGSKLEPILKIAEMLNLKAQPIRKAIEMLVMEDLLYTVNGRGVYVRDKESATFRLGVLLEGIDAIFTNSQRLGWFLRLETYKGIQQGILETKGMEEVRYFASEFSNPQDLLKRMNQDRIHGVLVFDLKNQNLETYLRDQLGGHRVVSVSHGEFPTAYNELRARVDPGIHEILQHALELGHKHFAFLYGRNMTSQWSHLERYRSVLHFFQENSINVNPLSLVPTGGSAMDGYRAAIQVLEKVPETTLFFCATDDRARGVIQAIADKGLKVGVDVSVIGYDNMPEAEKLDLATVQVPREEFGRQAVSFLQRCVKEKLLNEKLWIDTKPILRKSLGPAPKS